MVALATDTHALRAEPRALAEVRSIQYLRGFAALGVALAHAGRYVAKAYEVDWPNKVFPGWLGIYGVAIFFAISGYLMAELIKRQDPGTFLVRRILRIYPPFFLAVFLSLSLTPVAFFGTSWTHILLLPAGPDRSALLVEWTLVHEVFFYVLVFALGAFGVVRWIPAVAVAWLTLIFALADAPRPVIGTADFFQVPILYANTGFAAGLLIPVITERLKTPAMFATIFAAVFAYELCFPGLLGRMWAGLGAAALVAAAVLLTPRLPRSLDALLGRWGDWSYGLYLIHVPVIRSALFYMVPWLPVSVAYPAIVALTLAAGAVMGMLDNAMHGVARRIPSGLPRQVHMTLATSFALLYAAAGIYVAFYGR